MTFVLLLQIIIVVWLIKYLIRRDKGPREPVVAILYVGMLGVFAVFLAGIINAFTTPIFGLPSPAHSAASVPVINLILGCLAIGVTEELCKALPLRNFIYNKGYFNEVSDGIIYFGITGLIFGALENLSYAAMYGSAVGISRILTVPFMHAGFTSIVGYAVARQKVFGKPKSTATYGFLIAISLHAFYDFGLFYNHAWSRASSLALTVIINLAIFYLYRRARRTDASRSLQPAPAH